MTASPSNSTAKRYVVTGANRGLGLEFVRQLLGAGHRVAALAREPERAAELLAVVSDSGELGHVVRCDVADDDSVCAALAAVAEHFEGVDVLLNNAGVAGERVAFAELDWADALRTFEVNALGPLRVTRACLPLLARGESPRAVHVTSKMGSIADNSSGGAWGYRMSKTALNMACANLALELGNELLTAVIHPGWVRTDMGGASAPLEIPDSVARMLRTVAALRSDQGGAFVDLDGQPLPW